MLTCLNLVLVCLYAPADTYNRPITSEEQRHKQKIESFLTVAILYLLSVFFIKDSAISNLVIFTMTIESFMITPFAYKIFDNKYGIDRINEINREEERVC
jgi:accessory gene regulator protein AgrB